MLKLTSLLVMTALAATACSSSSDSPSEPDPTPPVDNGDSGETPDNGTPDNGTPDNGGGQVPSSDALISGNLAQFGVISIDETSLDQEAFVGAGFYRFPQQIDAADLAGAIGALNNQDFCSVSANDDLDSFIPTIDDPDLPDNFFDSIEFLSAGEVITLAESNGSTYGELLLTNLFGIQVYAPETELSYPVPAPLIVNIPGAEFPAFSNVQVPGATPLTGFSGATLTAAASSISWTAGSDEGAQIALSASTNDFEVSLDCILIDDGSYTLPAATVTELNSELGTGWSLEIDELSRTVIVVRQSGNSVLVVTRINE